MKKSIFLILTLFFSSFSFAQEEDVYVLGDSDKNAKPSISKKGFDWSKVTLGGGLGLTFGTITLVEVAPTVGYYLTDNILAGVGVNYIYYEDKSINFNTSIYGARVFGEYLFDDLPFLAHVETEIINIEGARAERLNIINLYVGGGLKQQIGRTSYFYLLALWNLNETKESYFLQPNPIIRLGIAIGL